MSSHRTRISENAGDVVIVIFTEKNRIRNPNYSYIFFFFIVLLNLISPTGSFDGRVKSLFTIINFTLLNREKYVSVVINYSVYFIALILR